jgi:MFS superfamily sulfate permease-like transporter
MGALPGIRALANYRISWLRSDIVAGVVLTTLLVPQGMAYAELAGLPAITGPLHHDPVPGRLRGVRALADPGARA